MTERARKLISAAKVEKNPRKSLEILQKALEIAEIAEDSHLVARCLLELTASYKLVGQQEKELECLSKAEEIAEKLPESPKTGAILSEIAVKLRQLGEYKRSLRLLERALPFFENAPERAAILCNMGNCYYELNDYRKALTFYVKAKRTFKNYPYQLAICLQNIGNALREMKKFEKALEYYEKALEIFVNHECTLNSAHIVWNQAIVYDELGQFEKALSLYDEAISVLTRENQLIDLARIYNDKGMTLRKLTQYTDALPFLKKALSLFEQYNMPVEAVETKRNIAGLKRNLNQYEEALQDLYSAREELERLGRVGSVKDVEWEIANVYASANQPVKALTYYDMVLEYYRAANIKLAEAQIMRDKAAVLENLGKYDEALDLYFQAESIFSRRNLPTELASTKVNRGNLYRILNRLEDAQKLFEEAKTLYQKAGIEVHAAEAEFNRAAALYGLSRAEDALSLFQKIKPIFLKNNQIVSFAEAEINEAVILGELGQDEKAISLFESTRHLLDERMVLHQLLIDLNEGALLSEEGRYDVAFPLLKTVSEKAIHMNLSALAYKACWALGYIHVKKEDFKTAYHYLRKSLGFVEKIRGDISPNLLKMSFLSGVEDIYSEMVFLTHRMGMNTTAFSILQKMKARTLIEETIAVERTVGDSEIPFRISKLYSELYKTPIYEKVHETLNEIVRLEAEYAEMIMKREIYRKSLTLPLHVKRVQVKLHKKEALLEYVFEENRLILFLLTPRIFKSISVEIENNLETRIYEYFSRVRSQRSLEHLSPLLCTLLINPVLEYLLEGSLLHIVPYKQLYLFPFHALCCSKFLAKTYQFIYHPAGMMVTKEIPSGKNILVVGDPDKELEGAEKECKTIHSIAEESGTDTTLLLGDNATKERFYELYPEYDIIHMACHGLYNSLNPLRSGLKLHDGMLTALEMHQLDLKGKLIVLGACGSGSVAIEKGSELLGITRALLCAGGFTITSLWEIPDADSGAFWKIFYESLINREKVPRALQRAQHFMLSTEFNHPYFWAGYRIMG